MCDETRPRPDDRDCAENAFGGHIGSLEGRLITSLKDLSRGRLRLGSKAAWLENREAVDRAAGRIDGDLLGYALEFFTGAVGASAREERLWLAGKFGGGGGVVTGRKYGRL